MPTPELPTNDKKIVYQMLSSVIDRFFIVAIITYFCLFLIDTIWPGFVSVNLDMTTLLWIVIISGVVSSILPRINETTIHSEGDNVSNPSSLNGIWWPIIAGVLVGVIIYWLTRQIGHSAIIVALMGGFITAILAKLFILWED